MRVSNTMGSESLYEASQRRVYTGSRVRDVRLVLAKMSFTYKTIR